MEAVVTIKGLDALKAKLEAMDPPRVQRIQARALRKGAEIFQAEVQAQAPERTDGISGTALPPGALKNDIQIVRRKSKTSGERETVVKPGKHTAYVARWVELGHDIVHEEGRGFGEQGSAKGSGRKKKKGVTIGRTQPNAFVRRAFETKEAEATAAIEEQLRKDLGGDLTADAPPDEDEGDE